MRKKNVLKLLAFVVVGTTMMFGQASRTWVSGVGDDANPCSRTAPCKTWAGAISKTAAGGEIDALDPGGFGALTITKSITLDGGGGQVASTLVSGTNGIVVTDGGAGTINVIIRNLRINGLKDSGNAGLNGINFLSGHDLNIENCVIFGFNTNGINVALNQGGSTATVHIVNTIVKNIGGDGVFATNAQGVPVKVAIFNSEIMLTNIGVEAAQHSRVTVANSLISAATADAARADDLASTDAQMTIQNSTLSNNGGNGVNAQGGSSVSIGGSTLSMNGNCGLNIAGGSIFTFQQGGQGTNRGHANTGGNTCGGVPTGVPQF